MVLKVSICLPGDTVITLETSEPDVFREVVEIALRGLPTDLVRMQTGGTTLTGWNTSDGFDEKKGNNVTAESLVSGGARRHGNGPDSIARPDQDSGRTEAEESFARLCGSMSPLGDMRRVVVAAEGARMYLGMEMVSERDLGRLFDLAGWRQPGELIQTIRNAARNKFRWLERVSGNPGCYAVTQVGREKVIGPPAG